MTRDEFTQQSINERKLAGYREFRAWTIIPSGEIQRPHYRYLVK